MKDLSQIPGLKVIEHGKDDDGAEWVIGVVTIGVHNLRIIASVHDGWEHVSVSLDHRCPTWEEMEDTKRRFFRADECAFQLHPPLNEYINNHPFTLHIWRCQTQEPPRPPWGLV